MLLLLCTLLLGSAIAHKPLNTNQVYKPTKEDVTHRLPIMVLPMSYEITIEPDFDLFTFRGFVHIYAALVIDTNEIVIHSDKIEISSVEVEIEGVKVKVIGGIYDEERHFYTIMLETVVLAGDAIDISISYIGQLNENNEGFYRAKTVDADGTERWLGTTQFEPTYARQAFPCFDEPALKANFTVNLIRHHSYTSASNMNLLTSTQMGQDRFMDIYETSVKMSTYLVAFVVSELGVISNEDNQSVYARPEAIADGYLDYALDCSLKVLEAIEMCVGVPYTLDKMGQVAIPDEYFSAGAMENWGLVIYRESLFFYKETESSTAQKQKVLSIIGHEYGHQWFGNLVSPLWWEFLWLNEGFATYFEYYAADVVDSSFRMMDQYVTSTNQYAMIADARETTRPMSWYVEHHDDVNHLFDVIAYDKSAAVIRMAEHYLSYPVFSNGLNNYLNMMAFSTGVPSLLFDGFQEAVNSLGADWMNGLTVHEVFDTWHTQKGYPYVEAIRDYDTNVLHLTQERFHNDPNATQTAELWYIPINFVSDKNLDFETTTPTSWMTERLATLELTDESWIIINKKSTGYYRVNYDETNWMRLSAQLKEDHTIIDPLNRAQIIDDSFSLAKAGIIGYEIPLAITEYIENEIDFIPLTSYNRHVNDLNKMLTNTDMYETFRAHVRSSLELAYETHSFDKDITEHTMILNRGMIHNLMCRFGYEKCTSDMEKYLIKSLTTGEKIHPDLQSSVYCGGMVNNNQLEMKWEKMYERYTVAKLEEKTRIIEGLACSSDKTILKRLLLTAAGLYQNHKLVGDDTTNVIKAVSSGSYLGAVTTLEFLLENYQNLNFTDKQKSTMLNNISEGLFEPEHIEMLEKLSSYKLDTTVANAVNEAISNIDVNVQVLSNAVPQLTTLLKK